MVETLGKYKIDGFVAEGGMARILRAKTEGVGGVEKTVALKCLKGARNENDSFVQMLLDEARITVRMTHKNICQVYGLEHDADQYFMVMEYIDGVSLAELSQYLFSKGRIFPTEAAVFIAMEVCSGLSYAHRLADETGESLGIVHRDVNPQNICISKEGEVKLIDFGIAKSHGLSSETQSGTIKGKFNYMSPEQARGDRVDQRTDVFALGAVLYEMLCGHMLYPLSYDDAKLRQKTRMADFVPIESYLPDIPDTLRKIIAKALTRDVNQRFASSRDFLLALTQFFHDSCKVYDSLDLSLLVSKYLKHQAKGDMASGEKASISRKSSDSNKKVTVRAGDSSFEDSGDTAIINAAEASKIAASKEMSLSDEESATTVYSKADFDAAVKADLQSNNPEKVKLAQACGTNSSICGTLSSVDRCVDLEVKDAGKGSTVMVKLDDFQGDGNQSPIVAWFNKIMAKVLSIDEKTLVITAVSLAVVLVISLILFFALRASDEKPVSETGTAAVQQQSEFHSIMLASLPSGADVYVDGESIGVKTPYKVTLTRQSRVVLKLPYYEPYEVSASELSRSELTATLALKKVLLEVSSKPKGATVQLQCINESGITPLRQKVPMNKPCSITVSMKGYQDYEKTLEWDEDSPSKEEIFVELKKSR